MKGRMMGERGRKLLQRLSDVTSKTYEELNTEAEDSSRWKNR